MDGTVVVDDPIVAERYDVGVDFATGADWGGDLPVDELEKIALTVRPAAKEISQKLLAKNPLVQKALDGLKKQGVMYYHRAEVTVSAADLVPKIESATVATPGELMDWLRPKPVPLPGFDDPLPSRK